MEQPYNIDEKIYPAAEGGNLSMTDMLAYFEKMGAMRVSDLHIKIGTQPAYRIDGELARIQGNLVTPEMAEKLIYPLLGPKNIEHLNLFISSSFIYRTQRHRCSLFSYFGTPLLTQR